MRKYNIFVGIKGCCENRYYDTDFFRDETAAEEFSKEMAYQFYAKYSFDNKLETFEDLERAYRKELELSPEDIYTKWQEEEISSMRDELVEQYIEFHISESSDE